jgi:hypothetical protein
VQEPTRAGMTGTDVSLPANLRQAVREELRCALHPPYAAATVVVGNGALMAACWTLLPPAAVNMVFRFHGPLAFALVLAIWMYADVPATNVLGGDPVCSIKAVAEPAALRRLLFAKNIVLWMLATPLCTAAAIGIGSYENRPATTALTVLWIAAVPLGALAFANWVGIWFPYHPLPLRYRWMHRRRWRPMLVRWITLVLTPYAVVPLVSLVLALPSLLLWRAMVGGTGGGRISDAEFGWGLLLTAVVTATAWLLGYRYGPWLAGRRGERLTAFLADPDRG